MKLRRKKTMPATPERIKQKDAWDKLNTKQFKMKLQLSTDADIIAALEAEPNKQGYIKALIRADIARRKSE